MGRRTRPTRGREPSPTKRAELWDAARIAEAKAERDVINVDITSISEDGAIYINRVDGETVEGTLRILPDTSFGTELEFQRFANDVWNDTGIVIAASTVYLGRELQISSGGEWVLTKDTDSDIESLLPHVRFDLATGTESVVTIPQVSALVPETILQPDDSGEISESLIQWSGVSTSLVFANALRLRTGSKDATGPVNVALYRDGFGDGLFYSRNYPASTFTANTDITLATDGLVELFENETFYFELTCDDGILTLAADATNTTPYWGGDFYFATEVTLTPDESGGALSRLVFDNRGNAVCDNAGDAVFAESNGIELAIPQTAPAPAFISALTFDDDQSTLTLSLVPSGMYRFQGTNGATLTLSDVTKSYADADTFWNLIIKDEGGNCTTNPLTIAAESGTIDGATSIQIIVDYGSVYLYCDGTNFWSI